MFALLAMAGDLGGALGPATVSYTHLDVYKRQVQAGRTALRPKK